MAAQDLELQRALQILDSPEPLPVSSQETELQRALSILDNPEPTPQLNILDKAAQLGRGYLASGPGGLLNLVGGNQPIPERVMGFPTTNPEGDQNKIVNPHERLTKTFDKLYGKDLTPRDTAGKIRQGAGEIFTPAGILNKGKAAYAGGKSILKAFGKKLSQNAAAATGASAAINAPGHLTEEGGLGRVAEDIGRGVAGAITGKAALNPSKTISSIVKNTKDLPGKAIAKVMSFGAKPDKEVLDLAKNHGIELPHNIGMNSKALSGLENNYLNKSMFTSQKHKDVYKTAGEKMLGEVNQSIDKVSKNSIKPSDASSKYKTILQKEEKAAREQASKLYEHADSFLTEHDKLVPHNTKEAIASMQKILDRDIRGPDNKTVTKYLGEIAERWGLVKGKELAHLKNDQLSAENINKIFGKFKGLEKEMPLERLVGVNREINSILKSEEPKGVKNLLRGLQGAITKDIESSANKEFVSAYKDANLHYSENVGKRFNTKTPRSILKKDIPSEAFSKMNTLPGIKALEKSIGTSPEAVKAFGELKRAKLEEMLEKATVGGLETGDLSNANFTNLFTKNKKRQEVLEYLLGGKAQYKKLQEISKITNAFSKAGKDIINTSGTAPVAAEWSKLDRAAQAAFLVLMGTEPISGLVMAGSAVGAPNILSRIVSNPNIVNQARTYARARQLGNNKYADSLAKNLIKMVAKESSAVKGAAIKNAPKKGDKDE